jgi:hypothetical protein
MLTQILPVTSEGAATAAIVEGSKALSSEIVEPLHCTSAIDNDLSDKNMKFLYNLRNNLIHQCAMPHRQDYEKVVKTENGSLPIETSKAKLMCAYRLIDQFYTERKPYHEP